MSAARLRTGLALHVSIIVQLDLRESANCSPASLLKPASVLLGLGSDRWDDKSIANLPVQRPPRALACLRTEFSQVVIALDGAGVREPKVWPKRLEFLDGMVHGDPVLAGQFRTLAFCLL